LSLTFFSNVPGGLLESGAFSVIRGRFGKTTSILSNCFRFAGSGSGLDCLPRLAAKFAVRVDVDDNGDTHFVQEGISLRGGSCR
jgi:hypothetical protein